MKSHLFTKIGPADLKGLSKPEIAYRLLQERILEGVYPAGHKLVLDTISREIDMSVVPVREAVRRLETEGMVVYERNVGAKVAEIDAHEYRDTMEALSVVEGAAVMLASGRYTREDIAEARALNEQMRESLPHLDPAEFSALNKRFHLRLTDACDNAVLSDMVDACWKRLMRLGQSTFAMAPNRAYSSVDEHEGILNLIESGADPSEIERAVRAHRLATPDTRLQRINPQKN